MAEAQGQEVHLFYDEKTQKYFKSHVTQEDLKNLPDHLKYITTAGEPTEYGDEPPPPPTNPATLGQAYASGLFQGPMADVPGVAGDLMEVSKMGAAAIENFNNNPTDPAQLKFLPGNLDRAIPSAANLTRGYQDMGIPLEEGSGNPALEAANLAGRVTTVVGAPKAIGKAVMKIGRKLAKPSLSAAGKKQLASGRNAAIKNALIGGVKNVGGGAAAGMGSYQGGQLLEGTGMEPIGQVVGAILGQPAVGLAGRPFKSKQKTTSAEQVDMRQLHDNKITALNPSAFDHKYNKAVRAALAQGGSAAKKIVARHIESLKQYSGAMLRLTASGNKHKGLLNKYDKVDSAAIRDIQAKVDSGELSFAEGLHSRTRQLGEQIDSHLNEVQWKPSGADANDAEIFLTRLEKDTAGVINQPIRKVVAMLKQRVAAGEMITGDTFQSFRKGLDDAIDRTKDPVIQNRLLDFKNDFVLRALDNLPAEASGRLQDVRSQYAKISALNDAVNKSGADPGFVDPKDVERFLQKRMKATWGRTDDPGVKLTRTAKERLQLPEPAPSGPDYGRHLNVGAGFGAWLYSMGIPAEIAAGIAGGTTLGLTGKEALENIKIGRPDISDLRTTPIKPMLGDTVHNALAGEGMPSVARQGSAAYLAGKEAKEDYKPHMRIKDK